MFGYPFCFFSFGEFLGSVDEIFGEIRNVSREGVFRISKNESKTDTEMRQQKRRTFCFFSVMKRKYRTAYIMVKPVNKKSL